MPSTLRRAEARDVEKLEELEREISIPLGLPLYTEKQFRAWLSVHPEAFVVVENGTDILGYSYSQVVDFGWIQTKLENFSLDEATDGGTTVSTHDPDGDSLYGVSLMSRHSGNGVGRLLNQYYYELARAGSRRYFLGFSRLSGFDTYMEDVEKIPVPKTALEADSALWYAYKCARAVDSPTDHLVGVPSRCWIEPKPDRVLAFHLRGGLVLQGIVPDFMPDPQSRNYAAFVARELGCT